MDQTAGRCPTCGFRLDGSGHCRYCRQDAGPAPDLKDKPAPDCKDRIKYAGDARKREDSRKFDTTVRSVSELIGADRGPYAARMAFAFIFGCNAGLILDLAPQAFSFDGITIVLNALLYTALVWLCFRQIRNEWKAMIAATVLASLVWTGWWSLARQMLLLGTEPGCSQVLIDFIRELPAFALWISTMIMVVKKTKSAVATIVLGQAAIVVGLILSSVASGLLSPEKYQSEAGADIVQWGRLLMDGFRGRIIPAIIWYSCIVIANTIPLRRGAARQAA